jgi:thiol-disulfide isomerase/thioredoxin
MISVLLAAITTLAPILAASTWANVPGPPPVSGRVTVVDVFAFTCINCIHVVPELQKLNRTYSRNDLQIIGIHAPELAEERNHASVLAGLKEQQITWPVLFDDGFRVWNAYGVNAWPTQLIFDRHGKLRATYVGEGYDAQIDRTVSTLIAERT